MVLRGRGVGHAGRARDAREARDAVRDVGQDPGDRRSRMSCAVTALGFRSYRV